MSEEAESFDVVVFIFFTKTIDLVPRSQLTYKARFLNNSWALFSTKSSSDARTIIIKWCTIFFIVVQPKYLFNSILEVFCHWTFLYCSFSSFSCNITGFSITYWVSFRMLKAPWSWSLRIMMKSIISFITVLGCRTCGVFMKKCGNVLKAKLHGKS